MIHRPSLTAFAADLARLAGTLLAASIVADYAAEARAAVRDVHRLTDLADTLIAENADLRAEVADLRDQLGYSDLDGVEDFQDFLYVTGGNA